MALDSKWPLLWSEIAAQAFEVRSKTTAHYTDQSCLLVHINVETCWLHWFPCEFCNCFCLSRYFYAPLPFRSYWAPHNLQWIYAHLISGKQGNAIISIAQRGNWGKEGRRGLPKFTQQGCGGAEKLTQPPGKGRSHWTTFFLCQPVTFSLGLTAGRLELGP